MRYTDACLAPACCMLEDGSHVEIGDSVTAPDGCNTCVCGDGAFRPTLACTKMACPKPTKTCAVNSKNGKKCEDKCCAKQDRNGLTCYWDGSDCKEGEMPTEPPTVYADCVMEDTIWKGKAVKKKGKDAEACFDMCAASKGFKKGKTCKAWSYIEGDKKPCRLFAKNKKTKGKSGIVSAKR